MDNESGSKRNRASSSDSDNSVRPSLKLAKTSMEGVREDTAGKLLSEILNLKSDIQSLRRDQEGFRSSMADSIEKLRSDIKQTMDTKFDDLHNRMNIEIGNLTSRIDDLDRRMSFIEQSAHKLARKPFDPDVTVVASKVVQNTSEDSKALAESIIQEGVGLDDTPVVRALRLGSRDGRPGLLKIELASEDDKIKVLRNKYNLENSRDFQRVFLRSSQSHAERLIQLNFRTILNELPNGGQFRVTGNGKLVRALSQDGQQNGRPGGRGSRFQQSQQRKENDQGYRPSPPRGTPTSPSAMHSSAATPGMSPRPQVTTHVNTCVVDSVATVTPNVDSVPRPSTSTIPVSNPGSHQGASIASSFMYDLPTQFRLPPSMIPQMYIPPAPGGFTTAPMFQAPSMPN